MPFISPFSVLSGVTSQCPEAMFVRGSHTSRCAVACYGLSMCGARGGTQHGDGGVFLGPWTCGGGWPGVVRGGNQTYLKPQWRKGGHWGQGAWGHTVGAVCEDGTLSPHPDKTARDPAQAQNLISHLPKSSCITQVWSSRGEFTHHPAKGGMGSARDWGRGADPGGTKGCGHGCGRGRRRWEGLSRAQPGLDFGH